MISREEAKAKAQSRDCSCVAGKDRDNNYNEAIDAVYDSIENEIDQIKQCLEWSEFEHHANALIALKDSEDNARELHKSCVELQGKLDSIGSCGECRHGYTTDGPDNIDQICCTITSPNDTYWQQSDSCTNFKRKEDD